MDRPVSVRLTESEVVDRAEELALKVQVLKSLRQRKRDEAKNTQALIDTVLDRIEEIAATITNASALRNQGQLFAVAGAELPPEAPPLADDDPDENDEPEREEEEDDGDEDETPDEDGDEETERIAEASQIAVASGGAGAQRTRRPRGPLRRAARRHAATASSRRG